jgi:hypothetical protein
MAYEYDVFFSYKRDVQINAWHVAVKDKLKFWLGQFLGREAKIFMDTEEIRVGARWRSKLAHALGASKTLVCVWSPLYFQSQWCVSEWKTFTERERSCDRELIAPASFIDGDCFPSEAQARQFMDFSDYTCTTKYFWDTAGAVEFEKVCLKSFAKDLARLIKNAPDFAPDFPLVEADLKDVAEEPTIGRIADV